MSVQTFSDNSLLKQHLFP